MFHTPAHKNTVNPPGQVINPIHQGKTLKQDIKEYQSKLHNPSDYDCKDIITLTRKELKALLVKLDRPESAKALCRLSEGKVWYLIQAIEDTGRNNIVFHPKDEDKINNY